MSTPPSSARDTAISLRAQELAERISELTEELDAANHPDRAALRSLNVTNLGWTPAVYSDEAFRIWSRRRNRDPEDSAVAHHLAIMHHARAIDLEHAGQLESATTDWQQALRLWFELWTADDFWERLASMTVRGDKREFIDTVRANFPATFLQIHYDIATATDTTVSRRNFHIDFALNAPFPDTAKTQVRTNTYERYAAEIPDSVWQSAAPEAQEAERAGAIILKFLEIDPGCVAALSDALRIVVRVIRARLTDYHAMDADAQSERNAVLHSMREMSEKWRPYFDDLISGRSDIEQEIDQEIDQDTARDYCLWARVTADVLKALDDKTGAITFYQLGARVGEPDEKERLSCERQAAVQQADQVRDLFNAQDPSARAQCDALAQRQNLTILARMLIANTYQLLGDIPMALKICEQALAMTPEMADFDFMDEDEDALTMVRDLQATIIAQQAFDGAQRAWNENRFADGRVLADQAIAAKAEESAFFLLRARCNIGLLDAPAAQTDLDAFCQLEGAGANADVVTSTTQEIEVLEQDVLSFGHAALVLKRRALLEFHEGQLAAAGASLRSAVIESNEVGRTALREELAVVLSNLGVEQYNTAEDDLGAKESALTLLLEAVAADPDNEHARDNLGAVQEGIAQVKADSAFTTAISAWQAHDMATALINLDEVIAHQPTHDQAFYLRARCHLAQFNTQAATADLEVVRTLAPDNTELLEHAANIQTDIAAQPEAVTRLGEAVYTLIENSKRTINNGDYQTAILYLRDALSIAGADAIAEATATLSTNLGNWGVELANSANENLQQLKSANANLQEAVDLDVNNEHAASNLVLIKEAVASFEINQLRNNAATHFNADRPGEAVPLLEEALQLASEELVYVVKGELATVLESQAVSQANRAQELYNYPSVHPVGLFGFDDSFSSSSETPAERLRQQLEQSRTLLERAEQLDPSNQSYRDNRNAVIEVLNQLS